MPLGDSELLNRIIRECGSKETALRYLARLSGYTDLPPTIDEFLDSDEYGADAFGSQVYEPWRQELRAIFPYALYSPYKEICVTGAIGTGKSMFCRAGMAYDLCCFSFIADPYKKFHLKKLKPMEVAFITTTKVNAEQSLGGIFRDEIKSMPFFQKKRLELGRRPKFLLPPKINLIEGSREGDSISRDVIMAMLSEVNFMGQSRKDQAVRNYLSVKSRIESRFARDSDLIMPGRVWLDSSRKDESGFLETHMKQALSDPEVRNISKAIWEIRKAIGKEKYSGQTFKVYIGDPKSDPKILGITPGDSIGIKEGLVIDVPIEHRRKFERNIYIALREEAGVATWSSFRLFDEQQLDRTLTLPNPCYKTVIEINRADETDHLIKYVDIEHFHNILKKEPFTGWFVHFDIGITRDACGIGLSRITGETSVNRADMGGDYLQRDLTFHTDLAMCVKPAPGKELPISRLRDFVIHLVRRGIPVFGTSADQFQSKQMLQELEDIGGIPTTNISCDRPRDAYEHYMGCLYEGRWRGPNHPILRKELLELEDNTDKIDHPQPLPGQAEEPSKDMADGVAGSVYNAKLNSGTIRKHESMISYAKTLKEAQEQSAKSFDETLRDEAMRRRPGRYNRGF